jgi:hypothetical protein
VHLWKISYVSIAAAPDEILDTTVLEICALSEQHNARAGITGLLTFHAGRFAQVLEGPESEVRALLGRIIADPRHHSVNVIADGPIPARRYAEWSMAYREPKDFMRTQLSDVLAQTAAVAEAVRGMPH